MPLRSNFHAFLHRICEGTEQIQNIIYIQKENAGVWRARRTGLFHAKGQWMSFVDCDDWCDQRMMELSV